MVPMTDAIRKIPKAELHVHIEGTVTPEKCRELAKKNGIQLIDNLFTPDGTRFNYTGFHDAVTRVYNGMAQAIRTRDDYRDITYDYLHRCDAENSIYEELIAWCAGAREVGLSYKDMIDGMVDGIRAAKRDFGIEARINTTLMRRNFTDPQDTWKDVEEILSYQHEMITGVNLSGGEVPGDMVHYTPMLQALKQKFTHAVAKTPHAGEAGGPENVWAVLNMNAKRIGHGVRSIEDPALVKELARRQTLLEISLTSNILAGIYPSYQAHPIRGLFNAGVNICLNSDDPGLFDTTIGAEYQVAHDELGFTSAQLLQFTKNAIESANISPEQRVTLRMRVAAYEGWKPFAI